MLGCNNGDFIDVTVPNGITYAYGSFNTPSLYTGIRTIYSNNGRWTWYTDRVPSGDHKFIRIVEAGSDKSNILKGDPITYPGPSQQESGAYIFDGDDDYMTLKGNNNSSFTISMRVMPDQIREMDISAMSEYPTSGKNDRNLYLNSEGRIISPDLMTEAQKLSLHRQGFQLLPGHILPSPETAAILNFILTGLSIEPLQPELQLQITPHLS